VFFISDKNDIKKLPKGIPFILASKYNEKNVIRILEYEVLYQEAVKSNLPFNFKQILLDNGYLDLIKWGHNKSVFMEFTTEGIPENVEDIELTDICDKADKLKDFIRDSTVYVNVEKLKALNVFPVWLDVLEKAISTNLNNFATYDSNMYNKKLGGMFGSMTLTSPRKNLIIIDISGSIPRGVSAVALTLAKNLAESFYADIMITGSKSTLYLYENLYTLDINTIYDENGMGNDQAVFKKLVMETEMKYETAIVFGDNHSPSYAWGNEYNKNTSSISTEKGKELCKWEINKLISFHTDNSYRIAGYSEWFEPKEIVKIADWVKYLDK
jgi:hypothetical protein